MRRLLFPFVTLTSLIILLFSLPVFAEAPGPKIRLERTVIDYGQVPAGEIIRPRFPFRNVGNAPLNITNRLFLGKYIRSKALEGC